MGLDAGQLMLGVDPPDNYREDAGRKHSPIMKTTVTIARLKRRGYIEFYDYFQRFNHKGNYKLDFEFSC